MARALVACVALSSGCSSCKDEKPASDAKKADGGSATSIASASAKASGSSTPSPLFPKPPDNMMVLCPKCGKPYKQSEVHVAPVYNDGLKKFVPSHRCEGHFKDEVEASRRKLQTANDKELESFMAMAKHHGNEGRVMKIAGDKRLREAALAVLDAIEKGELELQF